MIRGRHQLADLGGCGLGASQLPAVTWIIPPSMQTTQECHLDPVPDLSTSVPQTRNRTFETSAEQHSDEIGSLQG